MKKESLKIVSLTVLILFFTQLLFAVPAIPTPITFTQPDGYTLTIMIKGDERVHWSETMDGYTLLHNKAGFLTYAVLDENGNLQPSEYIATDIEKRDAIIVSFLSTIEKKLFYSDLQLQIMRKVWEIEDEALLNAEKNANGITGHYKTICAFVQFSDKKMIKNMEDFEPLFNELGYSIGGAYGSVKDYFREVSYNKMDITVTIFGVFEAPNTKAYYAQNSCIPLARFLAKEISEIPGINFKDYDSNGDKKVDGFHFIFAGRGQETTSNTNDIWSHKSEFNPPVENNGVSISTYSCSPELHSTTNNITAVGVICHEMGHAICGAADYYDTNYETGGNYVGTGKWDLMANGNYNGGSMRPAHPNMLVKIQCGWATPTILNSPKSVTNMPNSAQNPIAYRINTNTTNEYYLLENRQQIGFDKSVPGSGLLIYHVDRNQNSNCINCTHPQRMYPVCAASNTITQKQTANATDYGSINNKLCTFPSNYKDSFSHETVPAMKSWYGNYANVEKPITNITNKDGLVSFEFMGGTEISEPTEDANSCLTIIPNPANNYIDLSFSINSINNSNIDFYNSFGILVKSIPCNGVIKDNLITQRISISDLSKGFYFVNVGNLTAKLIIQ